MRSLRTTLLSVGFLAVASAASAVPVAVDNFSFELPGGFFTLNPPNDWTQVGGESGDVGTLQGNFPDVAPVPEGNQVTFVNPSVALVQTLAETLTAGVTYNLTVAAGVRDGNNGVTGLPRSTKYEVRLVANGEVLASTSGTAEAGDLFTDVLVSYTATGADAQLGQALQIELASVGLPGDFDDDLDVDGADFLLWQRDASVGSLTEWEADYGTTIEIAPGQGQFDNVRLDATAGAMATVSEVPEPTTAFLLGLGMLATAMARRRRKCGTT